MHSCLSWFATIVNFDSIIVLQYSLKRQKVIMHWGSFEWPNKGFEGGLTQFSSGRVLNIQIGDVTRFTWLGLGELARVTPAGLQKCLSSTLFIIWYSSGMVYPNKGTGFRFLQGEEGSKQRGQAASEHVGQEKSEVKGSQQGADYHFLTPRWQLHLKDEYRFCLWRSFYESCCYHISPGWEGSNGHI